MDKKKIEKSIKDIDKEIKKINDKKFKMFFLVYDTKGVANGELEYLYELALSCKKAGYKVEMLYTEKEFVGVEQWLGKEYAKLPHTNGNSGNINVNPSDVFFIPASYCSVMAQSKNLPCKRVAVIRSTDYLLDSIQFGSSMEDLRISDCIVPTNAAKELVKGLFPNIKTHVIIPRIDPMFKKSDKPEKMIVNIVSKHDSDVSAIVKSFYLRYPIYRWIAFRQVKNISRKDYAKALQEAPITIWMDPTTDFGSSAIEAMACGSIVIGKVPEYEVDWCFKDGHITDNALWFYNIKNCSSIIASVIQSFLFRNIGDEIYKQMESTVDDYKVERYDKGVESFIHTLIETRVNDFKVAREAFENNKVEIVKK